MKLFISLLLFSLISSAQPTEEYKKYKELAPNAEVIATNYAESIDLSLDNDKLLVKYYTNEEFFYVGNNTHGYSERSISYSNFFVLKNYQAYTLKASGNKYKKILVNQYKKNTLNQDGVFYDDNEELKFELPQIEKGNKSVIKIQYEITDPHMLPVFSLSPYIDYYNVVFTLSHDKNITVAIDTMNMGDVKLNYSIIQNKKVIKHIWKIDAPKKINFESYSPQIKHLSPQLIFWIKSYINNKEEKIKVLDDLNDLHNWYCSFVEKSIEKVDAFKELSDSIVGICSNNLEKASKIYNWVQENIRYIAFEYSYAGLIPEKASLVCKERYGDCKGISNLLYHLLRSQNIDAYLCWIGTRDLPYKYSKLPSPVVDNHMIVALKNDSSYLFLDATNSNLAFGMPSPFIQSKEALINKTDCKGFDLVEVPEIEAETNTAYDSCVIKIQGKDIIGNGFAKLSGYIRMNFIDGLNEKNYKYILNYCRNYLLKGSNKFILDTVWLENLENKNQPLLIKYKFKIPDYVILIDGEYYINLNLDKVSMPPKINMDRNVAVEYRFKSCEINIVNLDIEFLGKINELPSKTYFKEKIFNFENNYVVTKNNLIRYQKSANNLLQLNPNEFKQYNNLIEIMQANYQKQLSINTKIK